MFTTNGRLEKMNNNENLEEFINKLKNKIEELKGLYKDCWICGELTNEWGILMPEKEDSLGLGYSGKDTYRIAFFPVCKTHNIDNEENKQIIYKKFALYKMQMLN